MLSWVQTVEMQNSKGFFLTLLSNSCLSTFPSNTVANFKVKLPAESISLEDDWEVALVEMLYIHTPGAPYERGINKLLYMMRGQVIRLGLLTAVITTPLLM